MSSWLSFPCPRDTPLSRCPPPLAPACWHSPAPPPRASRRSCPSTPSPPRAAASTSSPTGARGRADGPEPSRSTTRSAIELNERRPSPPTRSTARSCGSGSGWPRHRPEELSPGRRRDRGRLCRIPRRISRLVSPDARLSREGTRAESGEPVPLRDHPAGRIVPAALSQRSLPGGSAAERRASLHPGAPDGGLGDVAHLDRAGRLRTRRGLVECAQYRSSAAGPPPRARGRTRVRLHPLTWRSGVGAAGDLRLGQRRRAIPVLGQAVALRQSVLPQPLLSRHDVARTRPPGAFAGFRLAAGHAGWGGLADRAHRGPRAGRARRST